MADQALKTKFIQGIVRGNLEPESYVAYAVQDAAYCREVVQGHGTVIQRAQDDALRGFLEQRRNRFKRYTRERGIKWDVDQPPRIELERATKEYIDWEKEVASEYDPLYFVVASIPCSRLWYWLAHKVKPCAVSRNLYQFWIDEHSTGDGGVDLEGFVDEHASSLDEGKALNVYRKTMIGEVNFFRSACGESLIPMKGNSDFFTFSWREP